MARGEPFDETRLRSMITQRVQYAKTYMENEIAGERSKNLRYYLARPFGNEVEGRSEVISTDVYDTIEGIMPDAMEVFNSGPIVRFLPVGPEDEDFAEQVTDYVNEIVWRQDNDGYNLTHDWVKDTLVEKNGVAKVFWDDTERETVEDLENVTLSELAQYEAAEDVKIEEAEVSGQMPVPDGMGGTEMQDVYSVRLRRVEKSGKLVVDILASEEFGIDAADKALDEHTAFCYHRVSQKTRSDWVEEGFDYDLIYSIPSDDDLISDRSRRTARARNADQQSSLTQWSSGVGDRTMQRITMYECYPRMDYEGTGVAKRYLVWAGGENANVILPDPESGELATEVEDHPFQDMTAIRQTHRWAGRALADAMRTTQEVKSTLQRQFLDNVYNVNNARAAVSNKVSLEDYLNNEVAGVIEVDTDMADVGGHVHQLAPNFIGPGVLQALEYYDQVGQQRSGVSQSTALDPEALHKTASGANLMLGEMHKRMLYYMRMMAGTGFVPLFKKILKIVVANQDVPRTVRLRGKWVEVDPQRWTMEFDVKPVVGLGHGTRTDKVASANAILEKQAMIVQQQQGIEGPFVYPDHISNALEMFADNLGVGDAEMFFADINDRPYEPKPQQPDPEVIKAQQEMELKRQQAIADAELDRWKAQQDYALKWAELQAQTGLNLNESVAKMNQSAAELEAKTILKAEELNRETALEVEEMRRQTPRGQGNIPSVVNG